MTLFLALILGSLFGFTLHRVGASNPQRLIQMLRLSELHLAKTILLAIALSSILLFLALAIDWIDSNHLSIKVSHWGVPVGGAILGLGWAASGYCPGTAIAALGDGRKDAVFFVLGGFFGAMIYMLSYPLIQDGDLLNPILGGNVTLASVVQNLSVFKSVPNSLVALAVSLLFGFIAWKLPRRRFVMNKITVEVD